MWPAGREFDHAKINDKLSPRYSAYLTGLHVHSLQIVYIYTYQAKRSKAKANPLHAIQALKRREGIVPTSPAHRIRGGPGVMEFQGPLLQKPTLHC
jgi:hypothetical protein